MVGGGAPVDNGRPRRLRCQGGAQGLHLTALLPSSGLAGAAARSAPPAKFVYLLGADDYDDASIPKDAFVVYQVGATASGARSRRRLPAWAAYARSHALLPA